MTEREELETLARCLDYFDGDLHVVDHTVVKLPDGTLVLRGDGVDYTKEEAIKECDLRIRIQAGAVERFRKEIAQVKGEPEKEYRGGLGPDDEFR